MVSVARLGLTSERYVRFAVIQCAQTISPQDVQELQALLGPVRPGQLVQAVPGGGLGLPIWILGSSLFGAQLAAALGLPYAFASHFAPDALMDALAVYRRQFQPSAQLEPAVRYGWRKHCSCRN